MKTKLPLYEHIFVVIGVALFVLSFFIPNQYNLYDYLKHKRLQSYNQKHQEHFITCIYCKGTGERIEDTNRIIFMAKTQLYLNKHLMIDKCKNCKKLEHGGGYIYCDEAERQYQIFLQEYGAAGPKMEKNSCGKCMGMGKFSSFDIKTQKYLTQEEYEQRERDESNN
jgi:hypothetical protein